MQIDKMDDYWYTIQCNEKELRLLGGMIAYYQSKGNILLDGSDSEILKEIEKVLPKLPQKKKGLDKYSTKKT